MMSNETFIDFLSSDDSDFINGSEIKIDGGWLAAKTRAGEINIE